jgi:putative ABC transport system ATP-binding protein
MSALVELAGVTKHYPGTPPVTVLAGVDLRLDGGCLVAVTGPSGSGKSTMLNLLGLLDDPTAGYRAVGGVDTAALDERAMAAIRGARIGFVFQAANLIGYLNAVDNVMLPLVHLGTTRADRRPRAVDALRAVGLDHRLGASPATLSGGERQRVALARAVVHDPPIVLCDEPTGNLDRANTDQVLRLLRGMVCPERVVVIVSHDRSVEEYADRVVRIDDGRVR